MMQQLQNLMRQTAQQANQAQATTRLGTVTSYDPNTYMAKAMIQPEGIETGWLPVGTLWVGNGWGFFCPPTSGDMVQIEFQEGGIDAGLIVGRFFNDSERPANVSSGEMWLVHKLGGFYKLTNDGKTQINGQLTVDATAPTINLTAIAAVNVIAPSINLGAAGQALKALITDAFLSFFNSHTHTTGTTGNPTGVPNQTATAASLATTTVKGG